MVTLLPCHKILVVNVTGAQFYGHEGLFLAQDKVSETRALICRAVKRAGPSDMV